MECSKCGRPAGLTLKVPEGTDILLGGGHGHHEQLAWECGKCGKIFCGRCAYPRWQALKAKEGLGGLELEAKLERDPNACFHEQARCPNCKTNLEPKHEVVKSTGCYVVTATYGKNSREAALVHAKCRRTFLLNPFLTTGWCLYKYYGPIFARWSRSNQTAFWLCKVLLANPIIKATGRNRFVALLCLVYLASLSLLALFLLLPTILVRLAVRLLSVSTRTYRPLQSRLPKGSA